MIIGIDLGVGKNKCAIVRVDKGKILNIASLNGITAAEKFIEMMGREADQYQKCVIEYPDSPYVDEKYGIEKVSGKIKFAMGIGKLQFLGDIIEHELTQRGVKVLKVKPKKGTTKLPEAQFRAMFNWSGPLPSQDEMDAAVLAFLHENDPQFLLMK